MINKLILLIIFVTLPSCFSEKGRVKELENRLDIAYLNDKEKELVFSYKEEELLVHDSGHKLHLISGSSKRSVSDGKRTLRMSGFVRLEDQRELEFEWESSNPYYLDLTLAGFEKSVKIENKRIIIEELFPRSKSRKK